MWVVAYSEDRVESDHAFGADGCDRHLMPRPHLTHQRDHAAVREVRRGNRISDTRKGLSDRQPDVVRFGQQRLAITRRQLTQDVILQSRVLRSAGVADYEVGGCGIAARALAGTGAIS